MAPDPPSAEPRVAAAVVNYNGRGVFDVCLDSLREQTGVAIETVFIDNASSDGSVEYVRRKYPEVRVVANTRNRGYAGGLNQAFEATQSDWLLALNTDIRMAPDFVRRLVECVERHAADNCGYAQGKVLYMTETGEPTGRIYSAGHVFPNNRLVWNRGAGQIDRGQYDREERVPGANAACLLMRRTMLDDLWTPETKVFDELFPMYGGDVDFDWLANCRGWAAWYCPHAVAWHVGEASSQVSRRRFNAQYVNNRFLVMLKNDRLRDLLPDLPRVAWRNARGLWFHVRLKPSMLWELPADLLKHLPRALRSRRATRHLRADAAVAPRAWMLWSRRLLQESKKWD